MKSKSIAVWALELFLLLAIARVLAGFIRYAVVAPPNFDGAMNLNTALSFLEGHGYGFFYGEFFPFPAQTDGPFTLPAALLMHWGGVTPSTTQGVNLAYLVGTVIVCFLLMRRITRSSAFGLLGTVILLMTPGLASTAMGGFGEIPVLFWFLLALLALAPVLSQTAPPRFRLILGGVALAFCYLTKTVAVLLVAPTFVLFAAIFVLRHRQPAWSLLWLVAGLVTPIVGWEVFRLVEVGGLRSYALWWRLQLGQTLQQSGANETLHAAHRSALAKGEEHLGILAGQVGTPPLALGAFLLLPWLVVIAAIIAKWRQRDVASVFCLAACVAVSGLYFLWWLLIEQTQMAWLRRIVDGFLLQQILLVIALAALAGAFRSRGRFALPRRIGVALLLVILLIPEAFLFRNGQTLTNPPTASDVDLDTLALANKVRDLPADATLFGFGWWKDPVLALFSGRDVTNYYYWDPAKIDALPHKYLLVDSYAKELAQPALLQDILLSGSSHAVADGPGGAIYEMDKVLPYRPFPDADRDPAKLRADFKVADGSYAATRGFYDAEGASAWAKPDAALLLRRTDQTQLSLSFYMPSQIRTEEPGTALVLRISSPGCLDSSVPIEPGVRTIVLPLTCPPPATPEAIEVSFYLNGHIPTVRQIDADKRRLAYLVTDIRLQGP